MQARRLHNTLFALAIGLVMGATAWSYTEREPGSLKITIPALAVPKAQEKMPEPPKEDTLQNQTKKKNEIEKMIERGALSKHPARYYKKIKQ